MFHFPSFPPLTLCVQVRVTGHDSSWVSPFGHPRITARLPTPRGLSQAPTSFIGSWCQGIHHVPFIACRTTTQQKQQPQSRPHCVEHTKPQKTRHEFTCLQNCLQDARVHYPDLKQQTHQPYPARRQASRPSKKEAQATRQGLTSSA